MKKASKILLLVGGITSICLVVLFFVLAIFFIFGASPEFEPELRQQIQNGTIKVSSIDPNLTLDEKVTIAQALYSVMGVMFVFFAIFSVPAVIFAFISRNKSNKGLFIADIVFGVLNTLILIGGILGLIARSRNIEE